MKFLSFFTNIKFKFSSMMGVSTVAQNVISAGSNNAIQSPNNFWENLGLYLLNTIADLLIYAYELVVKIVYAIMQWVLVIIDFLFILIRQMIGLNADYSSTVELSKSDMIFKFVFSDSVMNVIKGMIGFAIVLIILFSIFAIIKSEYDFVATGESNSKGRIFASTLKSLMLMLLVPILFIGGIITSNAILKSLYIATAGGKDTSLATQIFIASTYDANAYRRYANRGYKIPITYNFDEVGKKDNVSGWGTDGEIAELDSALAAFNSSSVWNRGYTTFLMFYNNGFLDMDSVDEINLAALKNNKESSYQGTYDKKIYTNKNQYYIMADLIEYAMRSGEKLYIKSAESIYKSYYDLYRNPDAPSSVKNKMKTNMPIALNPSGTAYEFSVHYKDFASPITFSHEKGALSESEGAKYLIAVEETIEYDNKVYSYYYPLLSTDRDFKTNYYEKIKQPIVAKGLFENGEYPTGIREQDGIIKFYRDDLNVPAIVDFFPTISYEMPPEGVTESFIVKAIKGGVEAVAGVDVTAFIPYVYYNFDLFSLFTKKTYNIIELEDGYIHISYNFEQKGYTIQNVYKLGDLNFNLLVLIASSILVLGMLLKMLFGIAMRVLDVVLMAITYPAVLSTFPLDNGERFSNWTSILLKKILSIYGAVLGINLVLMFFPFINNLEVFTPEMIETAVNSGQLPIMISASFLNILARILFQLVAFTMLESAGNLIDSVIQKSTKKNPVETIMTDGAQIVNDLKSVPKNIGKVISGEIVLDIGKKALETATSFVPGSAVAGSAIKALGESRKQKMMKDDLNDFKNKMNRGDTSGFEEENQQGNGQNNDPNQTSNEADPNMENSNPDPNNDSTDESSDDNNTNNGDTNNDSENADPTQEAPGDNNSSDGDEGDNSNNKEDSFDNADYQEDLAPKVDLDLGSEEADESAESNEKTNIDQSDVYNDTLKEKPVNTGDEKTTDDKQQIKNEENTEQSSQEQINQNVPSQEQTTTQEKAAPAPSESPNSIKQNVSEQSQNTTQDKSNNTSQGEPKGIIQQTNKTENTDSNKDVDSINSIVAETPKSEQSQSIKGLNSSEQNSASDKSMEAADKKNNEKPAESENNSTKQDLNNNVEQKKDESSTGGETTEPNGDKKDSSKKASVPKSSLIEDPNELANQWAKKQQDWKDQENESQAKIDKLNDEEDIKKRWGSVANRNLAMRMIRGMNGLGYAGQNGFNPNMKYKYNGKEMTAIEVLQAKGILKKGEISEKMQAKMYQSMNQAEKEDNEMYKAKKHVEYSQSEQERYKKWEEEARQSITPNENTSQPEVTPTEPANQNADAVNNALNMSEVKVESKKAEKQVVGDENTTKKPQKVASEKSDTGKDKAKTQQSSKNDKKTESNSNQVSNNKKTDNKKKDGSSKNAKN